MPPSTTNPSSKPSSITSHVPSATSKSSSSTSYIHTGMGEIGNYRKSSTISLEFNTSSPPNPTISLSASSGIGGYGNHQNMRWTSTAVPSDDGEQRTAPHATVAAYRGIGDAGNRNVRKHAEETSSGVERMRAKLASVFG
jgi:hypothetical protein